MKNYSCLLLDLDGTITDPAVGITRSVAYALQAFGIQVEELKDLYPFIGPPLTDSFKEFYHFSDEEAQKALLKYRERYAEKGLYENHPYEGIREFLESARLKGKRLFVATSKPTPFAEKILTHFDLIRYFEFVGGSGLDGSRHTKAEVIRYVLEENRIADLASVVMIGDRKHDVAGAKETGIDSVGVLYGYGDREELAQAGAVYIVPDLAGLGSLLLS